MNSIYVRKGLFAAPGSKYPTVIVCAFLLCVHSSCVCHFYPPSKGAVSPCCELIQQKNIETSIIHLLALLSTQLLGPILIPFPSGPINLRFNCGELEEEGTFENITNSTDDDDSPLTLRDLSSVPFIMTDSGHMRGHTVGSGGGGAFVEALLSVRSGERIEITVGGGGAAGQNGLDPDDPNLSDEVRNGEGCLGIAPGGQPGGGTGYSGNLLFACGGGK